MLIGVISDTHADTIRDVDHRIIDALKDVDLVVHAGDITSIDVLNELKLVKDVVAVKGNMDSLDIKKILPDTEKIEIDGKKIRVIHGWGAPFGLEYKLLKRFDDVDVIIYGHTHIPMNKIINNTLLFNPGTARKSYGLLNIDNGEIRGDIIKL
ncbi:MAG: metallophosphoesterase [Candidatus Methanoliparum thermophilum]|uniref:Phosphoesterase n=1 Tax=Methanoliparum thermophilum TaxID=2491083 RepID=A0A520KTA8_METT2|nr:metallophosphoesterase [Candidatus Methanoliparum sp. LAM-1]RZN65207.1 MAG: metallophosphoesterase [Candidatus Methanoliparum thermophilum]BDC36609.1 phosphoesterase [Candidatus Methanoliparum sp. LAM-1]